MFDKKRLFESLCEQLRTMINEASAARLVSETESRAHKGAMSSRYDTFKEEAQALAGGHGKREMNLKQELSRLLSFLTYPGVLAPADKVQPGAIVRVKDLNSGDEIYYLIVSAGGGLDLDADDIKFKALSFSTPLGHALLRKEEGDVVEFAVEDRERQLEILEIQ